MLHYNRIDVSKGFDDVFMMSIVINNIAILIFKIKKNLWNLRN